MLNSFFHALSQSETYPNEHTALANLAAAVAAALAAFEADNGINTVAQNQRLDRKHLMLHRRMILFSQIEKDSRLHTSHQ